jgi:hypothetical protein
MKRITTTTLLLLLLLLTTVEGRAVTQLVEALRYKPEGRGFVPDGVVIILPAAPWH